MTQGKYLTLLNKCGKLKEKITNFIENMDE